MRVLLVSNASYVPPRGGSTRSNLAWLDAMAEAGDECLIVCAAADRKTAAEEARYQAELRDQGLEAPVAQEGGWWRARRGSMEVRAIVDLMRHTSLLGQWIDEWKPDWVLVSSEDISQTLLREAGRHAAGRLVYIAHTPQFFPFGEAAWHRDAASTEVVKNAAGVVTISQFVQGYVESLIGGAPVTIHPPVYGEVPSPVGRFGGQIGLINPCAVKGLSILLALAEARPQYEFLVLPGWGTTSADVAAMKARANVSISPYVKSIGEYHAQLSVLLVPSLWLEGFGLVATEAMLSGVAVMSSDYGGLRDARGWSRYSLPVRPIERYRAEFDERHMPVPEVPEQDIGAWLQALDRLMSEEAHWREVSGEGRRQAKGFIEGLRANALRDYLQGLTPKAAAGGAKALSPAQRALLLKKMQKGRLQ